MARRRDYSRRCRFESLECRRLLAGDVSARIDDGKLVIKGDKLDNGITITAGANAGEVVVTGVNAGGSATSVNGAVNGAVTLSGFTGGLKVDMKRGNDSASITDLTVSGKAKLEGGKGNDDFNINGVAFGRSLKISLGKGDDTLSLADVDVTGKAKVKGHRGDDNVTIEDSTFSRLGVSLGKGDDSLAISGTTVSVKTRLKGGRGMDTFANGDGNSLANLRQKGFNNPPTSALTLAISGPANTNEGSLYTLNLSSSGSGASTISQWTINWGDGSASQVVSGNPTSVPHTFADGLNNFTISATATNPSGTFSANTVAVRVNNVPPTLTISGPASVNEGALYTLMLSSSDPGTDTITQWTIDWGDGTANQVVSGNPTSVTHTYADGPNNFTISAIAMDEDGTFPAGNTVSVIVT